MAPLALITEILQALELVVPTAGGIASLFVKHNAGEILTDTETATLAGIHAAVTSLPAAAPAA